VASALTLSAVAQNSDTSTSQTATAASTDQKQEDETVVLPKYEVVAGFASSLAAAAEAKHNLPVIAEVLAAEDIGKLPDVSIADSLVRLPGLTTQRTNGRSQAINIRGLTPDYSTGLLNGLQQVSTNDNRGVEFDQYPAELLSGVVVSKTAAPNLIGEGLAGTIDLQTVRPLSTTGRVIAVGGYYDWTQLGQLTPGLKKTGEHATLSYIDQFDDNKIGFAVGLAHTSTPYEGQQFQAWGYPTDPSGNYVMGGTKSYVRTSVLDRNAIMATLEFKPNENIHSVFNFFHTNFKENQLLRGMEIPLAYWSSAVLQPGYTVTNGELTKYTLTNVQPVVRNDTFVRTDNLSSIDWNLALAQKSDWPTAFDAGYSTVTRKDENLETYSGLGFRGTPFGSADTVSITAAPGQIPHITTTVDYTNTSLFKLTDPQGWGPSTLPGGGMAGYLKYFQAKDDLGELKLSTKHTLGGIVPDMEVGLGYTDRYKHARQDPTGYLYNANGQNSEGLPPIIGTTDLSYLGIKGIYAYDPNAAYNSGKYWGFAPNTNYGSFTGDSYQVWEKLTTFYTQFNLKGNLGAVPYTGNIGFQVINTDQSSAGLSANGNTVFPVTGGAKYTSFDPSMNLVFTPFGESDLIRLSVARQEARPRMYDMRASRNYSYDATLAGSTDLNHSPWGGGSGNPALRPWKADSVDLSFEHYFKNNNGYISFTVFEKKLLTYIYNQNVLSDFSSYPYTGGTAPTLEEGIASTPVNGTGGNLSGMELTVSLTSDLLTNGAVKGFGVFAGGAITNSNIQPWGPGNGTAPISGLSKQVANITLYYEHSGFAARVSQRYRSSTREYITTFGAPSPSGDATPGGGFSQAQPETVIDAQISYAFRHGALKGLTIYLDGSNLNNEPLVTYNNGDPRQVMNYQKYGASYSAGFTYKY
jgi:iron complex outermembrane receptor protein